MYRIGSQTIMSIEYKTELNMGRDPLTMGYLDNLDNEFSNKYEKKIKNRKNLIDMFFYL
jgi:hypothetical protein